MGFISRPFWVAVSCWHVLVSCVAFSSYVGIHMFDFGSSALLSTSICLARMLCGLEKWPRWTGMFFFISMFDLLHWLSWHCHCLPPLSWVTHHLTHKQPPRHNEVPPTHVTSTMTTTTAPVSAPVACNNNHTNDAHNLHWHQWEPWPWWQPG